MQRSEPHLIFEVDLSEHVEAVDLVRELELRDVDAVKTTDRKTVRVAVDATDDGEAILIEPLVALEGWLEERGIPSVPVRLRGTTHVVRRRRAA